MAKGSPDYLGYSMFPNYGTINRSQQLATPLPALGGFYIHELALKGQIVQISLCFYNIESIEDLYCYTIVDGLIIHQQHLNRYIEPDRHLSRAYLWELDYYSVESKSMTIKTNSLITFNDTFSLQLANSSAIEDATIESFCLYYNIRT